MIYYALRCSEHYLTKLALVRQSQSDHHLVAVGGGLGFLHGISEHTRSLSVVDEDPEVIEYCRMVTKLMAAARSLDHFIQLVSGYRFERDQEAIRFTEPVDVLQYVRIALKDQKLLECYQRTIGAMSIHPESTYATLGQSKILFQGADLTPLTYSWRFGEGGFANADTFAVVQKFWRTGRHSIEHERIERFDFSALDCSIPVIVLASNCDSPLFTRGDVVFRSAAAGCVVPTRYISWHRDITLHPRYAAAPGTARGWSMLPERRDLKNAELPERGVNFLGAQLEAEWAVADPNAISTMYDLIEGTIYGGRMLVADLDDLPALITGGEEESLDSLYRMVAPCFFEILIVSTESPDSLLLRTAVARFPLSYHVTGYGQLGSRSYVLMQLLGLSVSL